MISSILRRAVAQPARRSLLAAFSTAANQPSELERILTEEGEKQKPTPKSYSNSGKTESARQRDANKWKPFQSGRFVRPHQLTYKARVKPTKRLSRPPIVGPGAAEARKHDVFYQLGMDPLDQCMNPALLSHFVSEMGKVYGRHITKLTTNSQRRVGKAVRRAKMMGIIPVLSRARRQLWENRI
ncbi:hypothetical protein HGRIS_009451 [Hohenbuehelia grisea]|uniref:Small ribosomal subunit protein bS18m n=1 Tax=Hohenbuehelia grisea TaxID=104357 RepID=A0ABR3J1F9_9AGAR